MITLDPELLEILACPACRSPLRASDETDELACTNVSCGLAYPVRDEIPVLLVDEARDARDDGPRAPAPDDREDPAGYGGAPSAYENTGDLSTSAAPGADPGDHTGDHTAGDAGDGTAGQGTDGATGPGASGGSAADQRARGSEAT